MQPGFDRTQATSYRPPAMPRGSSEDFLGLEDELVRRATPPRPRSVQVLLPQPLVPETAPEHEILAPGESLQANWPTVTPNTWRVQPRAPVAPEHPSWLLELDDASIPPAHPAFVPTSAPTNASFRDGTEVAHRVAPWLVRSLLVFAGLFLCAVITQTIIAKHERAPLADQEPVQPIARSTPKSGELAAPDRSGSLDSGRPGIAQTGPTRPQGPAAAQASVLAVYDIPAAPPSNTTPAASADTDPASVERWLAEQSRIAAPIADAGNVGAAAVVDASGPALVSTATGVWEGATIPVEALAGGLRLATPSVGRVRVRLAGGEIEEGRLTAIGRGRVWIDTDAGSIEVDSATMRGLEQISDREVTVAPPRAPERMRVRTAGGVFFGRVLARDGQTVTMITDAGTRVTVEAEEITDAEMGG